MKQYKIALPANGQQENQNEDKKAEIKSANVESILNLYEELSKVLTNEEMATFLENNKSTLSKAGISKSMLNTSISMLKNFDTSTVVDIVRNDLNINEIAKNSKEGATADSILKSAIKKAPITDKVKIICKLLFSNGYFRLLFALMIVLAVYSVIVTSFIFKKAKKPYYATYIPIYRDIIHLELCNFSPWLLILVFIPFIGWLALAAISVVR